MTDCTVKFITWKPEGYGEYKCDEGNQRSFSKYHNLYGYQRNLQDENPREVDVIAKDENGNIVGILVASAAYDIINVVTLRFDRSQKGSEYAKLLLQNLEEYFMCQGYREIRITPARASSFDQELYHAVYRECGFCQVDSPFASFEKKLEDAYDGEDKKRSVSSLNCCVLEA